ncbi:hypothetical protein ACLOJK_007438, partial [Asimina triloba]
GSSDDIKRGQIHLTTWKKEARKNQREAGIDKERLFTFTIFQNVSSTIFTCLPKSSCSISLEDGGTPKWAWGK